MRRAVKVIVVCPSEASPWGATEAPGVAVAAGAGGGIAPGAGAGVCWAWTATASANKKPARERTLADKENPPALRKRDR